LHHGQGARRPTGYVALSPHRPVPNPGIRERHGFGEGTLDFAFIDHAKEAYLPDLELILRERWLRPCAVVVADNVKVPGAAEYHAFMKANEGKRFHTGEHSAHVEYQTLLKDIVLVRFSGLVLALLLAVPSAGEGSPWPGDPATRNPS
jgi:hypothetical protein